LVEKIEDLPGPNAREILKMDKRYISPSYTRAYPAVIERGKGMYVWDVDGNKFLDFSAGIAVVTTGHCHPRVVKAIKDQASRLIHMSGTDFYYPQQVHLAEKLAEIVPGGRNRKVFFCNSGAEAVECAFKLARYHTGRPWVLAFYGAFHGRTTGALSLTASKYIQKKGFAPFLPGVTHVPYAYCYRCAFSMEYPQCEFACVDHIEDVVFRTSVPPEEVAAIIVEPIQGEGGYVIPPPGYFERLREMADKYDILLVVDEVQSGMGRTGKMFAIEHWDAKPDVVTVAKGVASGLPLGACIAPSSIMKWQSGAHASTFGGNPVACAAALETIKLLEESLIENAAEMGEYLLNGLEQLKGRYEAIGDVRGKGLMVALEIVRDRATREPDVRKRNAIVQSSFKRGLILLGCGVTGIRFIPPLIVGKKEIDRALSIFEDALQEF
jgi:4-aminobutyrate aminotransferase